MAIVDATGTGLFLAASVAVFTRLIGVSGAQIGLGLTAAGVVSLAAAMPVGVLVDRIGPRAVLAGISLWRAGGLLAYSWCHTFGQFVAVTCVLALADRAGPAVNQALVASVASAADRVQVMAVLRSVRNVGFTLGALLAAIALALDSRPAYVGVLVGDALSFVGVVLLVATMRSAPGRGGGFGAVPPTSRVRSLRRRPRARTGGVRLVLRDRLFLRATLVNAVLSLHMTLLAVGIPTWILEHTDVPRVVLAPLLALNTVLTVALQLSASRGTESVTGSVRALYRSGVALGCCCASLALVPAVPVPLAVAVLVVSVIALTGSELWQSAGGWGLSYGLAQAEHHGVYLSTFNAGVTAQQVFGPALIAAAVIPLGTWSWIGLAGLLATLAGLAPHLLRSPGPPPASVTGSANRARAVEVPPVDEAAGARSVGTT